MRPQVAKALEELGWVSPNDLIWKSLAAASEKILYSPRIAGDRDPVQERRKKRRLNEFWFKEPANLFPDEVDKEIPIWEGAKYQVTVNAYERDPRARRRCIEHYGTSCFICGLSFGAIYGEVAKGFIHVHHLRPLSEIDSEYMVDPDDREDLDLLRHLNPLLLAVLEVSEGQTS